MNYDATVRGEIKREQRGIVKSHLGKIIGLHVLYGLPLVLISLMSFGMSWGNSMSAAMTGNPYLVMQASQSMYASNFLIWALQLIVGSPLLMGLYNYYIELMRGGEPGYGMLFHPFTSLTMLWRSIRMQLCMMLRSVIWMVGPCVVLFAGITIAVFSIVLDPYGDPTGAIWALVALYVLFLAAVLLIGVKLAAYRAGYVRLHDNGYIGTWDATREGAEAFKGHYKDLLVFFLSFTPWYLLYIGLCIVAALPIFIGLISVVGSGNPYAVLTTMTSSLIVACILFIVVQVIYGSFLMAYQETSFLRLFECVAPAPEEPIDTAAPNQDVSSGGQGLHIAPPADAPQTPYEQPESTQSPAAPGEDAPEEPRE